MNEISFLLGAGFSIPEGYKGVKSINESFKRLKEYDFSIHTDGTVSLKTNSTSVYNKYRAVFVRTIKYYSLFRKFHYENFYDFLKNQENERNPLFRLFIKYLINVHAIKLDHANMLVELRKILNQLVYEFLSSHNKQKSNNRQFLPKPVYTNYTGFLDTIEKLSKEAIIHIHTLNHDLLFEKFGNSGWIKNNLSDGFETCVSPFYGRDAHGQKIVLPRFINTYKTQFRLYKLHGSIDYYPYHYKDGTIDNYIKICPNIGNTYLFKYITNPHIEQANDWSNFHSDFLSGTSSKIIRYKEWFYMNQFRHFKENLNRSSKLIIIGYGCQDYGVNEIIKNNFKKKQIIIINPFPGKSVLKFNRKFKSQLRKIHLEQLSLQDLN